MERREEVRSPARAHGHLAGPALAIPPELQALVSAEVARQVAEATAPLKAELERLNDRAPLEKASLVVFSGDLDRLLAALSIATGAAASGLETTMFFTFWGLAALKKKGGAPRARSLKQRLFALMTPSSTEGMGVSRMNFLGAGARMLRAMMKDASVDSVEKLMALARELGVRLVGCTMSMDVMGVAKEDLVDGVELGGAAAFLGEASRSKVTLFV
ncbi:MAG TPA: DsrE/DsrF/DrsH-like family protein [Myxococcales bacterium]|nr:DsrE/DsrF/DrsH-like family protein [Myxococcales bacterium]